jgi:NADH-quinone oxidoreductase subunit N
MDVNLVPLLPAAQVLLTALVVMVLDLFFAEQEKPLLAWISVFGLILCGVDAMLLWGSREGAFGDTFLLDNFSLFFTQIFVAAAILTVLSSIRYVREAGIHQGEFYTLILFATAGMIVMAAANDLIVFFLGLETMSVAVYVLTGIWRSSARSSEAAMKYFLMGAFATGFLLYGIALIYGATGSTNLIYVSGYLLEPQSQWPRYLSVGGLLLLVGFAFKVGAVPFHFWIPDVYEGAPTPVTGFMSVAVKAAAFAAWARILMHELSPLDSDWAYALRLLAIATMTLGNLLAISQSSVKRMLAYSSIAHAGYLLIGIVAGEEWGGTSLLFYLLTYVPVTFGAFAVITALTENGRPKEEYGHFAGLGFKRPFLAMAMTLFMLSLAGFPPLAGFTGKFHIFRSAIAAGHTDLAIIGVLNSLLSLIYYLRVSVMMYMNEGGVKGKAFAEAPSLYVSVALAAAATLYLGILPTRAVEWSRLAYSTLF